MLDRDPYLDDGMRGFIENFARRNHWRVAGWYDLDDLVQDGYLCYYKVLRHKNYRALTRVRRPTPDDVRQVMKLVKTTFTRHVHALSGTQSAVARTGRVPVVHTVSQMCVGGETTEDVWSRVLPSVDEGGTCASLLATAPCEVRELAALLAGDARDAYEGFRRIRCGSRYQRETHSQRAQRLAKAREGGVHFERTNLRSDECRDRRGGRAIRETTNQLYCRLLGLDSARYDVRTMLREHFS